MSDVFAMPADVTAARLTAMLRANGALSSGTVSTVTRGENDAFNSAIAHLALTYSPDAPPTAPRHLVVKCNLKEPWAIRGGVRETAFYRAAMPFADQLPMLARCYDAASDPVSGNSHVLLDDLSATHVPPVTRAQLIAGEAIPSPAHLRGCVDAIARFHTYWWQHPSLGVAPFPVSDWYRDATYYTRRVAQWQDQWTQFSAVEGGDALPSALQAIYTQTLARVPHLWERYLARRVEARAHLTLSHGDCYLSQFLCPRDDTAVPTYLVDFQGACTNFAAIDLVHLFATFWTGAQRREGNREEGALRQYHRALLAHGVTGYDWDMLVEDYRLALTAMIFYPVWDAMNGSRRAYWWPKMQRLTDAFADWQCMDFLRQ